MGKRTDIRKILILGSGPIVIGQACEFDYSGTQACKALRQEGYELVLANSNPATIMTDPEFSDRTYVEPLIPDIVAKIVEKERPQALLPTVGGQTALNLAVALDERGILRQFGVELIGAKIEAIRKAEDRELFKKTMEEIGIPVPRSGIARSLEDGRRILAEVGLPCIIRVSFNLGGAGSSIAYNKDEFEAKVAHGLANSMISEILIEESVIGWKEFEMEVMRDRKDNCVIVCSIENFDAMGVHTGDSITVAPALTLTDAEYQRMRDWSFRVIRAIGVETGGSNIQFAVHPGDGRMVAIEMNPRVSRSSALASKATGFPIAKIASLLAVGYTLDEIPNDITKKTPASFEPTIDYVVVKTPRWAFEKFPEADPTLTTQMKSVGEVMAIGRTFKEALQKAIRGLEVDRHGLGWDRKDLMGPGANGRAPTPERIREKLSVPTAERLHYVRYAYKAGLKTEEIAELSKIDPWFLEQIRELARFEDELASHPTLEEMPSATLLRAKRHGYSDKQLAHHFRRRPLEVRALRAERGIRPAFKLVDTCAAEFEAATPYYYSTYEPESELRRSDRPKVMILGGGPNRIGQGIEFDCCCVHAALALREKGFETIMVNSNPETVSTDYDISDMLFFEPLTTEDILNIYEELQPVGAIVQLGGQTPINLAGELAEGGVKILGTSLESIDTASDRKKFRQLLLDLKLSLPPSGTALTVDEARRIADSVGYPVLVRPSYVLGGRAMEKVFDEPELDRYMREATDVSPERPVLIDKFIEDAIEVDVDALCDGEEVFVGGILEHIEMAGIHSGDSAMALPPFSLSDSQVEEIKRIAVTLGKALRVQGLMNIQVAVKEHKVFVIEVNPRSSRTVPFVSKAIGVPLAKLAARVMVGAKLGEFKLPRNATPRYFAVKESVFPFRKFLGTDIILGPEMKSTGEVMGLDVDYGRAYAKAQLAALNTVPTEGTVFIAVKDADKRDIVYIAKRLEDLGFRIVTTSGTGKVLENNGIAVRKIHKVREGRPNALDLLINSEVDLIINTPTGRGAITDEAKIRSMAIARGVPVVTTLQAAQAMMIAIECCKKQRLEVRPLQEYYKMPRL
jgi:carbamoyl-phosphate synthase large subunit